MKLNFAYLPILALAFVLLPTRVFAAGASVSVALFDSTNQPEIGAHLKIVCNGFEKAVTSTDDNIYTTSFGARQCNNGDTVTVSAKAANHETGGASDVVEDDVANFTINLSPNVSVPEFGLIPGFIAAIGSAGAFLKYRKII